MELNWIELTGYIIGLIGVIFGGVFWKKWSQVVRLLKEMGEAFTKTSLALADKRLTKDEAIGLLQAWREVVQAVYALVGRK